MSTFKDKAIILKILRLHTGSCVLQLFSFDFGRISTIKKITKKEKNLDIGNIINYEITTSPNSNIHKIKNIKVISEFNIFEKNFTILLQYLQIIAKIYREFQEGVQNKEVFLIIEKIHTLKCINKNQLLLAELKIQAIEGNLNLSHNDKVVQKILLFVNNSSIEKILKLKGLEEDIYNRLKFVKNNIA